MYFLKHTSPAILATCMAIVTSCATHAEAIDLLTDAPGGWKPWSPRDGIRPKFEVVRRDHETAALRIETTEAGDFGAWKRRIGHLTPNQTYRFSAHYRAEDLMFQKRSVIPRLEWFDANGRSLRPPEYGIGTPLPDGSSEIVITTPAPDRAASAEIQLGFGFAADRSIEWSDIRFGEEQKLRDRVVRAMTIFHRPRGTKTPAESVEQFCQLALQHAAEKPDVVLLPEGISVVGTDKTYWEVSESIPGPSTERLGSVARQLHSYLVAGLYEREGKHLYNTAVLIGRDGKLAGKYRKTHLPREEWEAGITPGDEYPVFETDFGRAGLIICWDVQFPEPSRAMAARGADLLLLPIWGGSETLAKARAIENHVFLVSSSYDMKSFIVDPAGMVLAEATREQPVAVAELHFDRKIFQPWLGDMKARTWRERRQDIPVP